MNERIQRYFNTKLPAFANSSLSRPLAWLVALYVRLKPGAAKDVAGLQHLRRSLADEQAPQPTAAAWLGIRDRIQARPVHAPLSTLKPKLRLWRLAALVLAASTVLLWNILPPGIVLEWSFDGYAPEAFLVYRAAGDPAGGDETLDFALIEQVPVDTGNRAYRFTDIGALPGQSYVYLVEAIGPNGFSMGSDLVSADAAQALPGQAALVFAFIGLILALVLLVKNSGGYQRQLFGSSLLMR